MASISTTLTSSDAVAQTFFVDNGLYPKGVFLTHVTLFFKAKDATLPVNIELREVLNGYPVSNEAIPFSEVSVLPASINLPVDATSISSINAAGTTFTFESPLHVEPGEYAIVVNANSDLYQVFTAVLGDKVFGTSNYISKQPYAGSFFKSQNSSTWNAEQNEDMMFEIGKCVFTTGTDYTANWLSPSFKAAEVIGINELDADVTMAEAFDGMGSTIQMDAIKCNVKDGQLDGSTIVYDYKATLTSSGLLDTSFTSFVPDEYLGFGYPHQLGANGAFTVRSTLSTTDQHISPIIDARKFSVLGIGNLINNGDLSNTDVTITHAGSDYNAVPTITVSAPTATGGVQAVAVAVVNNAASNVISNIYFTTRGSGYIETPTLTISGANTTSNVATATIGGETSTDGGNMAARYITRRVTLADGFDATHLKVLFDGYKNSYNNFTVYYKVLAEEDSGDFDDKSYVLMTESAPTSFSSNTNEFKEYTFDSEDPVTYSSATTTYNTFKTFSIKICLWGGDSTDVPKIKNLRVLAVD